MSVLNPGQKVGLSPSVRFYLDRVKNWKGMSKDDPYYNALDVIYDWHLKDALEKDIESRVVSPRAVLESRFKLIRVCNEMEKRGLNVDFERREKFIQEQEKNIVELEKKVQEVVKPYWDKKLERLENEAYKLKQAYESMREEWKGWCDKHPKKYPGKTMPKTCIKCAEMYKPGS